VQRRTKSESMKFGPSKEAGERSISSSEARISLYFDFSLKSLSRKQIEGYIVLLDSFQIRDSQPTQRDE